MQISCRGGDYEWRGCLLELISELCITDVPGYATRLVRKKKRCATRSDYELISKVLREPLSQLTRTVNARAVSRVTSAIKTAWGKRVEFVCALEKAALRFSPRIPYETGFL